VPTTINPVERASTHTHRIRNPVERASTHTHRIRNPVERANTHTHRIMRIPIPIGLCEYPYPWDYANTHTHGIMRVRSMGVLLAIPRTIGW
jgi:hypothetical protein